MSYTPTNWQARDKVTAAKLNKIEGGIAEASDDNVFTFVATPEFENGQNTSYTLDCEISEVRNAVSLGKPIRCFIFYSNNYIQTSVNLELVSSTETNIYVIPIIKSSNESDVANFRIHCNSNFISTEPTIPKYILISTYGSGGNRRVPMVSTDSEILFFQINELIDIGSNMEQLIIGTHTMADQAGTATLSTVVTDSDMLNTFYQLMGMLQEDIINGRGVFTQMSVNSVPIYLNFNSYSGSLAQSSATIVLSLTFNDIATSAGVVTSSVVFSGTFMFTMHLGSAGEPEYAVVTCHLDKHEATIV